MAKKYKQVLKSADSRDEIYAAVAKKASKNAVKKGTTRELEESRLWNEIYTKTARSLDSLEDPGVKRQPKTMHITPSEAELDKRARKLQKAQPGMSYAQCASKALQDDPSLYTQYNNEMAAGTTYAVPQ